MGGGDEGEEEPQPRDLGAFLHDVHAEEVVGDDAFLDEVMERGMRGARGGEPVGEGAVVEEVDLADDGGVEVDEGLHGRDEEGAGAARGIEQAEAGEDVVEEAAAEGGVEAQEQLGHGGELAGGFAGGDGGQRAVAAEFGGAGRRQTWHRRCGALHGTDRHRRRDALHVYLVQDELVDGLLAEVAGDLRAGVVGAEFLLVDVFFEDVAEDVGVDFVVVAAGRVVEVPGVALEKGEEVFEGYVRDADVRVGSLDAVRQKEAAVEEFDLAEKARDLGTALLLGLGEAFKEKGLQEDGVVTVGALRAR